MRPISTTTKYIKPYKGYGHTHDLVMYGHVLAGRPPVAGTPSSNILTNMWRLLKLFMVKPLARQRVELKWQDQLLRQTSEKDGFVKFQWESSQHVQAGWHPVQMICYNQEDCCVVNGSVLIPHVTQFAFISDIDDTVMVSHSATIYRRLKVLFTAHAKTRQVFEDVALHYRLLAACNTTEHSPNPFFYVSSSEWNLYNYLEDFFSHHQLPEGVFLLNQIKRWYQIFKTGKTRHSGKLARIIRVLDTFPNQKFVLLGDNSQQDPQIYQQIANKYPNRIFAIYIRMVDIGKKATTQQRLTDLENEKGIHTCLFTHSSQAIAHSKSVGLIQQGL